MSDPVARIEAVLAELDAELDELHQGLAGPHVRMSQLLEKLRNRLEPLLEEHRPPPLDQGAEEWVTELLATARHDLQGAQTLAASKGDHAPTVAMLLQMVFEKLAKAYLARTDWPAFVKHRRSHAVAKRFAQFLKLNWRLLPKVGPHSAKVPGWVVRLTEKRDRTRLAWPYQTEPNRTRPNGNAQESNLPGTLSRPTPVLKTGGRTSGPCTSVSDDNRSAARREAQH